MENTTQNKLNAIKLTLVAKMPAGLTAELNKSGTIEVSHPNLFDEDGVKVNGRSITIRNNKFVVINAQGKVVMGKAEPVEVAQ